MGADGIGPQILSLCALVYKPLYHLFSLPPDVGKGPKMGTTFILTDCTTYYIYYSKSIVFDSVTVSFNIIKLVTLINGPRRAGKSSNLNIVYQKLRV